METIDGLDSVPSPALLFDVDRIERNIQRMRDTVAGDTSLLRPHIKTHKCAEVLRLQSDISQIKCATIAEAELAANVGVSDVLVAYPLVGPNARRLVSLQRQFPGTGFSTVVDSEAGVDGLEIAVEEKLPVFLDFDCGMHRTGVASIEKSLILVNRIVASPSLTFAGIHAYDGHIHDASKSDRQARFDAAIGEVDRLLARLEDAGIDVPLVVSGGSPTFEMHAERARKSEQPWQASPGTPVLWDAGYGEHYPEMEYEPAALLLARVVSKPGEGRICVDLGTKSVSAENPIANRVRFPTIPCLEFASQSEEHLVIRVEDTDNIPIGSELVGVPYHVCPSVALHQHAHVVRDGRITGEKWPIAARDREITI